MKILWLSEKDVSSLLTMDDALEVVKRAFRLHGLGETQMPPKSYLYYTKYDGDLRTMPGYIEELEATGVKIVNVHPRNFERGLPTIMALIVLNSPETGAPLAIIGGTYLTGIRTGAAGGVAAEYLARGDSKTVGLVGAGAQARTQLLALSRIFEIETVNVADITLDRARALENDCRKFLSCKYNLTTSPREVCDSDIIVTVTPSRKAVLKDAWIKEGTHINAIGADAKGKQELEPGLLKRAKIVVDDFAQATHSGEVNVPISQGLLDPSEIYAEIGKIVADLVPGRKSDEEITIFDSTGLAIQDIAAAQIVYRKALSNGRGVYLEFF